MFLLPYRTARYIFLQIKRSNSQNRYQLIQMKASPINAQKNIEVTLPPSYFQFLPLVGPPVFCICGIRSLTLGNLGNGSWGSVWYQYPTV